MRQHWNENSLSEAGGGEGEDDEAGLPGLRQASQSLWYYAVNKDPSQGLREETTGSFPIGKSERAGPTGAGSRTICDGSP